MERLSIKDYAKVNNISCSTVRRLIRNQKLNYVKFGNTYRILANEVPIESSKTITTNSRAGFIRKLKNICK